MTKVWQILSETGKQNIVEVLLANRGVKDSRDFFAPKLPEKIKIEETGIKRAEVIKATKRIKLAIKNKEKIIVYGDYDADGVCATAIIWETLYKVYRNVLPYIPERFSEGYGLNIESLKKLKQADGNLKLIITVDNGIVAAKAVAEARKIGIDIIITDHHEPEKIKPKALATVHTTKIGGSGVAWFMARELAKTFKLTFSGLELAAIGTIADQLPLLGINRSLVKWGLADLTKTKRPGLKALMAEAGIKEVGTYEVNYLIAPRINAMGRLEHAIESLRLLCTTDSLKAGELASRLSRVNAERQKIVGEVVAHLQSDTTLLTKNKIIVIAHESYHEGVIGLAAGKLVEEFYRPAIVISTAGEVAKASARSVSGFNIIEAIRSVEHLILQGGGHPMAAGFTIAADKIEKFRSEINKVSEKLLTDEILQRKLKIDLEIEFNRINWQLVEKLQDFEPAGLGNPIPTFCSRGVEVIDARTVGADGKHLKLKLKQENSFFNAIAFGFGEIYALITPGTTVDLAYSIEINVWNNSREIQLKVKDLKIDGK